MEIRIMPPLPRVIRITNHKKIKNQKMTVPREAVAVIIKIRRQAGVVTLDIPMSIAAVVDDEGIEIVHGADHAVVDQVTSGIDLSVENVIEIIGRAGQTGIDDLIVHIIITGQDLDHVKGQGREVEEEEVTIITIVGHPDQTGIDDHTVGQGHVNVGLEAGRRSRLIIKVVVLVVIGGEIDQDQYTGMDPVVEEIIVDGLDHVIGLEKTIMGSVDKEEVEIISTMAMVVVETTRITMVEEATTTIITTMAVHQEEERGNADEEIGEIVTTTIMETIKTTTAAATTTTMVEMVNSNIRALKEVEEEVAERKKQRNKNTRRNSSKAFYSNKLSREIAK